jgi:acetaldehyde dehydrogenase (acetylating)
MNIVIRMSATQNAKALPILLRHSPGVMLRNRLYIISKAAARDLLHARIKFSVTAVVPETSCRIVP